MDSTGTFEQYLAQEFIGDFRLVETCLPPKVCVCVLYILKTFILFPTDNFCICRVGFPAARPTLDEVFNYEKFQSNPNNQYRPRFFNKDQFNKKALLFVCQLVVKFKNGADVI